MPKKVKYMTLAEKEAELEKVRGGLDDMGIIITNEDGTKARMNAKGELVPIKGSAAQKALKPKRKKP